MGELEVEERPKQTNKKRNIILAVLVVVCLAVALTVGLVLHFRKPSAKKEEREIECLYRTDALVDCHPDPNPSEETCKSRGCSWQKQRCSWPKYSEKGAPWCVFSQNAGYDIDGEITNSSDGYQLKLKRRGLDKVFGMNIHESVDLKVFLGEHSVRLKFVPSAGHYYEIPEEALDVQIPSSSDPKDYNVTFERSPFSVVIRRVPSGTVIFNTSLPGLILSDQYLQLTTRLPSKNLYGFGEHNHKQLRHDLDDWKTWNIFTRDLAPVDDWNLYGAQPVYMNVEHDGKANMVFLKNSNGIEVALQPDPFAAITYRVIGGILDFYVFLGDSPGMALEQYTKAIGRPIMPPYWSLGFQLCKWGYGNLSVVKDVHQRMIDAGIPQDVQWGDIDYMYEKLDFTYDRKTYDGLPEFVDKLHSLKQKYIVMVDPGIGKGDALNAGAKSNSKGYDAYDDGRQFDIFVKDHNGEELTGQVWPGNTSFPDFTNPNSTEWLSKWIRFFRKNESVEVDGLWIDMNEPANFIPGAINLTTGEVGCSHNTWNNPPYCPNIFERGNDGRLYNKTLCMDSQQTWGKHYDVHNLYGHSMALRTHQALTEMFPTKRPMIVTRSNFAGTQKYATHWLGDNQSQWRQIPWSIIGILEYSIFGFSLVGADICGFWFEANYEMCLRWSQLGAFYPFSRNHNAIGFRHQDPAAWDGNFARIAKSAILTRYRFLPYLYTQFYHAHVNGRAVARPLMFEFPTDKVALHTDTQFLLGPALMISPVMEKGVRRRSAYFPKSRWFDYYDGTEISFTKYGKHIHRNIQLDAPLHKINLHLRGGHVFTMQKPANTTFYSRQNPMSLIVALDEEYKAHGDLFWDDGETNGTHISGEYLHLNYSVESEGANKLEVQVLHSNYAEANNLYFEMVEIYGLGDLPRRIIVDGSELEQSKFRWNTNIVQIVQLQLNVTLPHTIIWEIF